MKPYPRWLTWLVVLFLGYILVVGNFSERAPAPPVSTPAETGQSEEQKTYPALAALTDGDRWKKALDPTYQSPDDACRAPAIAENELPAYAVVVAQGEGEPAACGDTIRMTLTRWGNDGKANRPSEYELVLGEQPGLDALLRGMRLGEERLLVVRLPTRAKKLPLPAKNQLLLQAVRTQ